MSASVYVWYQVSADAASALAAIGQLFADVERRTGVAGRLLARVDDPQTWMEVYEAVGDTAAFADTLDARANALDILRETGTSNRHVERFGPLATQPAE